MAAGVKRIEGDLVGDESYFVGPKYGAGWEWEDLTWYYGAEITPLTVNDNALDLFIKPGAGGGPTGGDHHGAARSAVQDRQPVTTSAKGMRREISIHRGLGQDTITISGSIAVEDKGYTGGIGISHPGSLFVYLLREFACAEGRRCSLVNRERRAKASPR